MGWSGKKEYRNIRGELRAVDHEDFQQKLLPLLRILNPHVVSSPASRRWDRAGVDLYAEGEDGRLALVVQAKGYQPRTAYPASRQVESALHSIRSFAESGLRAAQYIFVHNRDNRDNGFRTAVTAALGELNATGVAREAELWGVNELLTACFDAMLLQLRSAVIEESQRIARSADWVPAEGLEPLNVVPVRRGSIEADQHRVLSSESEDTRMLDAAEQILAASEEGLTLVLGEFGSGKTTAVSRSLGLTERGVMLVPAARFSSNVTGTKHFFLLCLDEERFFDVSDEDDARYRRLVARPAIERILRDPETDLVLILDGLDESGFLSREGSLQHLFNILEVASVPVILAMRTEFWYRRRREFDVAYGKIGHPDSTRRRRISTLELMPWTDFEVQALVQSAINASPTAEKAHLKELASLLGSAEFERLYGDIPRRPLFLRFIIDSVREQGLPGEKVGVASLMMDWISSKLWRDALAPVAAGGRGRVSLAKRRTAAEEQVAIAIRAMTQAAACELWSKVVYEMR